MTATVAKIPDPLTVLTRAERKATGEEPGDLGHLAEAVRTQIIVPLTAHGTPVVDDVRVTQLLADKQRLGDLAEELRKQADTRGGVIDRQAQEIAELKQQLAAADEDARRRVDAVVSASGDGVQEEVDRLRQALVLRTGELDEARAERDTARAQLRDKPAAPDLAAAGQLQTENAELADQLARAQEQLSLARRDLALANRTLDEIADEEAGRPAAAPHRHQFEVDPATGEHKPCECKQPWIRDLVDDGDDVVPDIEPLDALFDRIRNELGEVAP